MHQSLQQDQRSVVFWSNNRIHYCVPNCVAAIYKTWCFLWVSHSHTLSWTIPVISLLNSSQSRFHFNRSNIISFTRTYAFLPWWFVYSEDVLNAASPPIPNWRPPGYKPQEEIAHKQVGRQHQYGPWHRQLPPIPPRNGSTLHTYHYRTPIRLYCKHCIANNKETTT